MIDSADRSSSLHIFSACRINIAVSTTVIRRVCIGHLYVNDA